MKEQELMRQLDILPLDKLNQKITIIGAGAIGSFTTLGLTKMGFHDVTVYDFDEVTPENVSCQLYGPREVGQAKVSALAARVLELTGTVIQARNERFTSQRPESGIVIAAVDSMAVRREAWLIHKEKGYLTRAFIDPRMSAEQALLYVMKPQNLLDAESYEKTLYDDTEAMQERCTAKATFYTANLLSGLVCKAVKDLVTDQESYPRIVHWDIARNDLKIWAAKR